MDETAGKAGLLQLLNQIHSQYGLLVLMLVLIIVFGCLVFWKLVWRVWSGTERQGERNRTTRGGAGYVPEDGLGPSRSVDGA